MSESALRIGLLTGCQDRPYAFGLATALVAKGVSLDFIGSDQMDSPELHQLQNLKFLNLKPGWRSDAPDKNRILSLLSYYVRLIRYAATTRSSIFHILWNNRLEYFDRTLLMLYFKVLRKKVTITAHNVNQARRDGQDSFANRLTLRIQYHLADHIFVHTDKMKRELCDDFGVHKDAVTVIRHPINNAFPDTALTPSQARAQLGIAAGEKTVLFFGRLRPYKGLEHLLDAFERMSNKGMKCRLIIAGESKKGSEAYYQEIERRVENHPNQDKIIRRIQFIPDEDAELYLKAADVMALPYTEIFQSGVLFLAYSFGLPVVASDVGSFREEIVEGQTGFLCASCNPEDLANGLERYFESDLFKQLHRRRGAIREYAYEHHSWDAVAALTCRAYEGLAAR